MNWMLVTLMLHILGVVVWVGGMFFAHQCLRPIAAQQLAPPERLRLWIGVFGRFFPWVWAAIAIILSSGLTMLLSIGLAHSPRNWHVMMLSGLIMMVVFLVVFYGPYPKLKAAVQAQDFAAGGVQLARIRHLVGVNILLGLFTIAAATVGRLFA
jgi:uncharacterized membrane protein